VIPVLHLNGYKIAGPTVLARLPEAELRSLSPATAIIPTLSKATILPVHQAFAGTLDAVIEEIRSIQRDARAQGFRERRPDP